MTIKQIFPKFSDSARIWCYGFSHTLTAEQRGIVERKLTEFLSTWNSHGTSVNGDGMVIYNTFVMLAVDPFDSVSGCSIDSSVRMLKDLKHLHQLDALNQALIHYREASQILSAVREDFQSLIQSGKLGLKTTVFNNTITNLGEVRGGDWEVPLRDSWHARAFQMSA